MLVEGNEVGRSVAVDGTGDVTNVSNTSSNPGAGHGGGHRGRSSISQCESALSLSKKYFACEKTC